MKKKLVVLAISILTFGAQAETLEEQLQGLNLPANQGPGVIKEEKLYAVQSRYSPLSSRHEASFWGGSILAGDGHISSNRVGLTYQYHINDKWGVLLEGSKIFNELNSSGKTLLEEQKLLPDKDFAKYQYNIGASYNTFYGKFRVSMDQVFYFDQYLSAGVGMIGLQSGAAPELMIDAGFAFWIGKSMSLRMGFKNEIYEEQRINGPSLNHNLVGHLDIGYVFGGETL